jgi:hypothetical protein
MTVYDGVPFDARLGTMCGNARVWGGDGIGSAAALQIQRRELQSLNSLLQALGARSRQEDEM